MAIIERLRARSGGKTWVFPSPSSKKPIENPQKAAERLRERSKVSDLRLHDLRRTAASLMTGMRISRLTVKKVLNHGERDVTAVYDRHSYDPEKRTALDAWGRRLETILVGKKPAEVVPLVRPDAIAGNAELVDRTRRREGRDDEGLRRAAARGLVPDLRARLGSPTRSAASALPKPGSTTSKK